MASSGSEIENNYLESSEGEDIDEEVYKKYTKIQQDKKKKPSQIQALKRKMKKKERELKKVFAIF